MMAARPLRRLSQLQTTLRRVAPLRALATAAAPPTPGADGATMGHDGKLVIVTGGANGIGRSVCLEFARCGANVLCADFDDDAGAETVAASESLKGSVKFMHADFTDASVPSAVVAAAHEWQQGAPVGCLVNNVGIQEDNGTPVHLLDEEVWDKVVDVNLKSYFLMCAHPSQLQQPPPCCCPPALALTPLSTRPLALLALPVLLLHRDHAMHAQVKVRPPLDDRGAVWRHHQHGLCSGITSYHCYYCYHCYHCYCCYGVIINMASLCAGAPITSRHPRL